MEDGAIIGRIRDIVSNIFRDNKIELVDIAYRREGGTKVLRILADTETGITVDECAKMNEVISETLDAENIIEDNYLLEVSSPGLDRPLKKKEDYLRVKGKRVRVCTFAPVDEKKEFTGTLESVDDNGITVSWDNAKVISIPFDKISKATLDYKNLI